MMIGGSGTTGGAPSAVANCAFTSGAWADVDSPSAPSRKGHAAGATSPGAAAGSAEAGTTGRGMDAVDDGDREVVPETTLVDASASGTLPRTRNMTHEATRGSEEHTCETQPLMRISYASLR